MELDDLVRKCKRLTSAVFAVALLGSVAVSDSSADVEQWKPEDWGHVPPQVTYQPVVFPAPQSETLGSVLYRSQLAIERLKLGLPLDFIEAALEAGDVESALRLSRQLPIRGCMERGEVNAVVQSDCASVKAIYLIARSPVAAWQRIDWHQELDGLDLSGFDKRRLLTSVAVQQVKGGDLEGAVRTALSHVREDGQESLEPVSALAAVAAVAADAGDIARALEIVMDAFERCGTSCRQPVADSIAYRDDIEWSFCRIASAQAELGDPDGASETVSQGEKLVGNSNWLDKARRNIALAFARDGRIWEAVYMSDAVQRAEWRQQVRGEVEALISADRS